MDIGRIEQLTVERDTFAHGARIASDNCVRLEGMLELERNRALGLEQRVAELERESDEYDKLLTTLTKLLTGTADALRGEPGELQSHSWHNLPELARAAVERNGTVAIRAAASPVELWWAMVEAQEELAGERIPDDAVVLTFSGSGASMQVTARQLRDLFAAIYPATPLSPEDEARRERYETSFADGLAEVVALRRAPVSSGPGDPLRDDEPTESSSEAAARGKAPGTL